MLGSWVVECRVDSWVVDVDLECENWDRDGIHHFVTEQAS